MLKRLLGKRKEETGYTAANEIEKLLELAADNEAYRPQFFRELLNVELLVIGELNNGDTEGQGQIANLEVLKGDDEDCAMVFTSERALKHFASSSDRECSFIGMSANDLLDMLVNSSKPTGMLLNKGLPYGKHFVHEEIKALLNNRIENNENVNVSSGAQIRLGIPAQIPDGFLDQLQLFVNNTNSIYTAAFGLMERNSQLEYVLAVDLDQSLDESHFHNLMGDISLFINDFKFSAPVDVARMTDTFKHAAENEAMILIESKA